MKIFVIGVMAPLVLTLGLVVLSCGPAQGNGLDKTPTPSQVPYSNLAEEFVKNSSTFKFDGIEGSIKLAKAQGSDREMEFVIEYQTRQPGHGDRTGQVLAQVITNHTGVINIKDGKVISAVCDNSWDMLKDAAITIPSPIGIPVSLGQEFTLPVGQTADVTGENLLINFVSVTADSRSPRGAQTIWAGEAEIQLEIFYEGQAYDVTLTEKGLTDGYSQDSFNQYKISFQLQPYPEVGKQLAPREYKLALKVTKL